MASYVQPTTIFRALTAGLYGLHSIDTSILVIRLHTWVFYFSQYVFGSILFDMRTTSSQRIVEITHEMLVTLNERRTCPKIYRRLPLDDDYDYLIKEKTN